MFRARFAARRLVRNISFGSYKPKNSDPQFVVTLENGFLPREVCLSLLGDRKDHDVHRDVLCFILGPLGNSSPAVQGA